MVILLTQGVERLPVDAQLTRLSSLESKSKTANSVCLTHDIARRKHRLLQFTFNLDKRDC